MTEENGGIEGKGVHVLGPSGIHLEWSVGKGELQNLVPIPCHHGQVLRIELPPLRVPRHV